MSEPFVSVVVREGRVSAFAARWGGEAVINAVTHGPSGEFIFADGWKSVANVCCGIERLFSMDFSRNPDTAYLVDYDRKVFIHASIHSAYRDKLGMWSDFESIAADDTQHAVSLIRDYFAISVRSERFSLAPKFDEFLLGDLTRPPPLLDALVERLKAHGAPTFEYGESLLDRVFGLVPETVQLAIFCEHESILNDIAGTLGFSAQIQRADCIAPDLESGKQWSVSQFCLSHAGQPTVRGVLCESGTATQSVDVDISDLEFVAHSFCYFSVDSLFRRLSFEPELERIEDALRDVFSQTARLNRDLWICEPNRPHILARAEILRHRYEISLCNADSGENAWCDYWSDDTQMSTHVEIHK